MTPILLSLCVLVTNSDPKLSSENPLYQHLVTNGLEIGSGLRTQFPAPYLADGLDAAGQKEALAKFLGQDYSFEEFTRNSVVAPLVLRLRDVVPSDAEAPARGVDVGFIVHGDFTATNDQDFLEKLVSIGRGEGGAGKELTANDLSKRGITLMGVESNHEQYGHIEFDFLDRVRLKATGRGMWSRTPESVIAAVELDPRFRKDAEFPCEWRSLIKEGSELKVGSPQPYSGAALYVKLTKLHEPAGAMFVEQHVVFVEPMGWFDGANLLRSKLPPLVQNHVRNLRREWSKFSK